jgi:hypothetical protein
MKSTPLLYSILAGFETCHGFFIVIPPLLVLGGSSTPDLANQSRIPLSTFVQVYNSFIARVIILMTSAVLKNMVGSIGRR